MSSIKRVVLLMVALIALFIGMKIFKPIEVQKSSEGHNTISELDRFLLVSANRINARLPIVVDSDTTLSTTMGVNGEFRYNYTLVNYTADEVKSETFDKEIETLATNSICSGEEMEVFFNKGASIAFTYHGKEGKLIKKVTVKPGECTNS